jgi:hypothetical protein
MREERLSNPSMRLGSHAQIVTAVQPNRSRADRALAPRETFALDLAVHKGDVRCGLGGNRTVGMPMPEAPVDDDRDSVALEEQVLAAWQAPVM